jgi:hypothetical protein
MTMHIQECLASAHPPSADAWKGKTDCLASEDPEAQEFNAMIETAQQLYEQYTQRGSPALTMFSRIAKEMSDMDFQVSREAARFATEARIHHMCIVAHCLAGPAHLLVTNLGPERFTEWKTALINEATGKMPRMFSTLEECVMRERWCTSPSPQDTASPSSWKTWSRCGRYSRTSEGQS